MRSSSGRNRGRTVGHGLRDRRRCGLAVHIRNTVSTRCGAVGVRVVPPEGVGVTVLTTSRLRDVRHDLHATGYCSSGTTAPSSVCRSCRSSKAFSELLNEGHGDIVCGDVYGISNTKDDERPFGRQGKASIGSVQTSTGRLLYLANADTGLANDGADEDMRN